MLLQAETVAKLMVVAYAAGDLDNNIAFFAVLGTVNAVNEYVNGVKLSALYPNQLKMLLQSLIL